MSKTHHKLLVYELTLRLSGNKNTKVTPWGSLADNGTGTFGDLDDVALRHFKSFGVTHLWPMGIVEHATMEDFSAFGIERDHPAVIKGRAGSPYAIKDYYDVNPYLATDPSRRMEEFEAMVERIHTNGLKIIIDFIPNHVSRTYHSDAKPAGVSDLGEGDDATVPFSPRNNFYYLPGQDFEVPQGIRLPMESTQPYHEYPARATGNDVFSAHPGINDWYETVKLNYGVDYLGDRAGHFDPVPSTWLKMRDILLFWVGKGVDGFRCDMAEMVPVEFWGWCIPQIKAEADVVFIAEIYNPAEYHAYIFEGGFDYLYDKVGLYDALRRLMEGHGSVGDITRLWQHESGDIDEHMLRFLENHDEQRIASQFFAGDARYARPAWVISATLGRGPLMYYFGQEVGEPATEAEGFQSADGRTTIFDWWRVPYWQKLLSNGTFDGAGLTPGQKELLAFYQSVNQLCLTSEAVKTGDFFDLQYVNDNGQSVGYDRVYSYLRYTPDEILLFVTSFRLTEETSTFVRIPDLFRSMAGHEPGTPFRYCEVFGNTRQQGEATEGIPVTIPPAGVLIFSLT